MTQLDENYNADLLDAMADIYGGIADAMNDIAYEQEQAMRESLQSEWSLIEDEDGTFIGFIVTNTHEDDDQT